jgi:hypothetical protein
MSETKRRVFMVIVLFLVLLFGVGQFFAYSNLNTANQTAQTGNQQPPTQVIPYVPPAPATSTPIEKGSCWTNSIAAPYRPDAWRCTVGNSISDPCFEIPNSTGTLACGADPAGTDTSSTFVLQLTKPLPPSELPTSTPTNWAWLVELGDGTVCSPFTGTRPFSATGEVATYACNGSLPGEDLIFGDLNDASATWTAEVGSLSNNTSTYPPAVAASATVPVFAVWQ